MKLPTQSLPLARTRLTQTVNVSSTGVIPQAAAVCTATCQSGFNASAQGFGDTYAAAQTDANSKLDVVCSVRGGVSSYDTCTPY